MQGRQEVALVWGLIDLDTCKYLWLTIKLFLISTDFFRVQLVESLLNDWNINIGRFWH